MSAPITLLSCIARAAAKNPSDFLTFGLSGGPLGEAWDEWHKAADEPQRRNEIEQLASAPPSSVREAAMQAARQAIGPISPEDRQRLEDCLANAPAAIRRSLRSPKDPSGKTLPPGRRLGSKEDLRALLPLVPSRFKAGDRPLPGVDYELVELLGVGGFGEVWKAVNPYLPGEAVALKFCTDPDARQRLLTHEARILGQLQGQGRLPGVVPLLRTYLGADPPCLEFEFVEGGDLAGAIRDWHSCGPPEPLTLARHVRDIAAIVGRAHRLTPPVVHRDIKPANILLQRDGQGGGRFLVADFGIGGIAAHHAAEQTRRGTFAAGFQATVAGSYTPLYASPQQMAGEKADPRDDVYSLGVVWHQMLTGDLNRGAPTGEAWKKRLEGRGMPAGLIALLAAALEHDREDRPDDASALGEMLTASLASGAAPLSIPAVPPAPEKSASTGPPRQMVNSIGMAFARIPAGTFQMGATKDIDPDMYADEAPRHQVTISRGFYLGIYTVTQAEFERVMAYNPSYFKGPNRPVEMVNWEEAREFCEKLSALPEENAAERRYRLPTEAEWEYACRGGADAYQKFNVGDVLRQADANFGGAATKDVGSFAPNGWGLYDMHGNVWEWCSDWYGLYSELPAADPTGPKQGQDRALRGGSWNYSSRNCRSASRNWVVPTSRYAFFGFRVVMDAGR
jgi:formylglycine-generating enzyme required for sulfatase activity